MSMRMYGMFVWEKLTVRLLKVAVIRYSQRE